MGNDDLRFARSGGSLNIEARMSVRNLYEKIGSFDTVMNALGEVTIYGGVAAMTVSRAIQGFVKSAATDLPKCLRINVISPIFLVSLRLRGRELGQAYIRSLMGVQAGQIISVF